MRHNTAHSLALVVLIAASMLAVMTTCARAQDNGQTSAPNEQSGAVADYFELPPLLIDLFHSTSGKPAGQNSAPTPQAGDQPSTPPQTPDIQSLANTGGAISPIATSGDYVPDEVLVTIDGDAQAVQNIATALGLQVRSVRTSFLLKKSIARLGIPDRRPVGLVLAQLQGDGRPTAAEPNHIYTLQQAESVGGYALETINFNPGEANGANIRVAVIDTARDKTHPALANITAEDFDALPEIAVSNTDHGTSIVGLIAGQDGFQGVAPGARIYHARAFENGKSNADAILAALDWSAEQNVQIINMSFVGPRNKLFEKACNAAFERGILLVAAAGNNGPKAPPAYPAAYKSVVAVTATDEQNRRMAQANIGNYIAISAPGVGLMAPIPGGGYDLVTGTSFAAAVFTGAVANLMRQYPAQSAFESERIANKTALDLGPKGKDAEFGFGLIDFRAALKRFND